MTLSVSGAPVLVVDLCARCFQQAQDATHDRIEDLQRAANAVEESTLPGERDHDHEHVIEGGS